MLRLTGVSFDFGAEPVFDRVDLAVAPGEFVVLLGPSGCGKTTLLRLAAGLIQPKAGAIANGFRRTTCVFQEPRLLRAMSALDNAAFGLKALGAGRDERRAAAKAILARLGFNAGDMDKRPSALSGGMAQRVAFARALAVTPDLLLMDEPFNALDIGLRRASQDIVADEVARSGAAALFVTHDITEAVRLADRILMLAARPGRIVATIANRPVADPAAIFKRAADLMQRPEILAAQAFSGDHQI